MNTDGSYFKETGRAGIGGIVRDEQGELIMAFSLSVQDKTNNTVEAIATKMGIQCSVHQGYNNIDLEIKL